MHTATTHVRVRLEKVGLDTLFRSLTFIDHELIDY